MATIADLSDPRLDPYRDLKTSNLTRWSGQFIAEGAEVVLRLLAGPVPTVSVLVKRSLADTWRNRVPPAVPLLVVEDGLASELAGFNFHQGVLACGRRPLNPELAEWNRNPGPLRLAAVDAVTDPDNVGSLIRLVRAFGWDGLILGKGCADPWSRRAVRVSMGNGLALPMRLADTLADDLATLRHQGVSCLATVLDPLATPLSELDVPARVCVVLGNERHGISPTVAAACDRRVTIPMQAGADSLNVAVAAGIVLYEFSNRGVPYPIQ